MNSVNKTGEAELHFYVLAHRGSILKRLCTLLFVIISFSVSACGSSPDVKSDEPPDRKSNKMAAQEYFIRGNTKLNNLEYEAAAKEYEEASTRAPKRWDIHMNRGIAYSRANKFDLALGAMEQALRNGGDKEQAVYFNLGNVYQERGMYSKAVDAYRAGLAVGDANNVDVLINLASAYIFLYDYEKADATNNHLRGIAPDDPRPVHGLALSLHMRNQYKAALDMYEEVHTIDSNFPLSYFNKSQCLAALDRYPEAIQALSTYTQKDPEGPYIKRAENLINAYQGRQ